MIDSIGVYEFTLCCGAKEIGNFPFHSPFTDSLTKKQAKEEENNLVATIKDRMSAYSGEAFIATTVKGQETGARALRRCKFKLALRYRNPNSGNIVKLWYAKAPYVRFN